MKLENIRPQRPARSNPDSMRSPKSRDSNSSQEILLKVSIEDQEDTATNATKIYGGVASRVNSVAPPLAIAPAPTAVSVTAMPAAINPAAQWSQSLQTVLDQPPASFPRKFIVGGLVFGCAFTAWSWFGTVQEVRYAPGKLIPQGEVYKVQPGAEGKIAKILVKEGQLVQAKDVIAEMDTRDAATNVERLEKQLAAQRLELLQTQGLIDKTRLESQTQIKIAAGEVDAQSNAISQAQVSQETSRKLLEQLKADSAAYEARLARLKPVIQEGAITGDQIFEVEQALRDRHKSIIESQGGLDKSVVEIQELQTRMAQKRSEQQRLELGTQQQLQQLAIKITDIQAKINETTTLLKQAQAQLKQQFLRSPVAGTVSSLNVHNIGEVAQTGQTIAEIASSKSPLILSALLPSGEAGFVKVGMPVQVKLDAFPYQEYGVIPGKVTFISADSKKDEQLGTVYRVEISLDLTYVTHEQQKISFKAGQTANAEIVLRQRRIADVLLEPIQKLKQDPITL